MTPEPRPQLRFSRYECKYLLTPAQVDQVRQLILPWMQYDPFSLQVPGRFYGVSSVYLDDARLRLYEETLDGLRDRFKLRIRGYSDNPLDPVFCEVKERRDRKIGKRRARLGRGEMHALLRGRQPLMGSLDETERGHLAAFRDRMDLIGASPKAVVRYEREALFGRFDRGLRITFDRNLQTSLVDPTPRFFAGDAWAPVLRNKTLLELKFNERCPAWVSQVIRDVGLRRISYSKYAHSVAALMRRGAALEMGS